VARRPDTPDVVEEIESTAERFAGWIASNPRLATGIVVAVIAVAATVGTYASRQRGREEAASNALDSVRVEYLSAMGAAPTALEVPELANPKAAQEIRERFLERFRAVAESERGTTAGTLAIFEVADLLELLGRADEVAAVYAEAAESAPTPALRAMVQRRLGAFHESAGRFTEAAAAYEAAAIPDYPLRYWSLADAARCRTRAGQTVEALALYDQIAAEAPDLPLPDHQAAQARELRAAATPQPATPPQPE
jgi:tetratricopeptide (TPR) repeat protein